MIYWLVSSNDLKAIPYFIKSARHNSFWVLFIRMCAYQGVRNVSFTGNFAYVLNRWSLYFSVFQYFKEILAVIYLFKVINGNTRVMREICSKLTIRATEWRPSAVFIVNWCFLFWLWTGKYRLKLLQNTKTCFNRGGLCYKIG